MAAGTSQASSAAATEAAVSTLAAAIHAARRSWRPSRKARAAAEPKAAPSRSPRAATVATAGMVRGWTQNKRAAARPAARACSAPDQGSSRRARKRPRQRAVATASSRFSRRTAVSAPGVQRPSGHHIRWLSARESAARGRPPVLSIPNRARAPSSPSPRRAASARAWKSSPTGPAPIRGQVQAASRTAASAHQELAIGGLDMERNSSPDPAASFTPERANGRRRGTGGPASCGLARGQGRSSAESAGAGRSGRGRAAGHACTAPYPRPPRGRYALPPCRSPTTPAGPSWPP